MGDYGSPKDKWVCPNDRQLALRAKLKTGWSVKSNHWNSFGKPETLNDAEQEQIVSVIKRAEALELVEEERVGRLVDRLENMKKHVMGNGTNQCILCGDDFGILGASNVACYDCGKAVCTKCGVDTTSSQKEPLWLCKICAETREMWKKSGAWFFRSLPKYMLPEKKLRPQRVMPQTTTDPKSLKTGRRIVTGRNFNTWSKGFRNQLESEHESEETSDDDDIITKGIRGRINNIAAGSQEVLTSSHISEERLTSNPSPVPRALSPNDYRGTPPVPKRENTASHGRRGHAVLDSTPRSRRSSNSSNYQHSEDSFDRQYNMYTTHIPARHHDG